MGDYSDRTILVTGASRGLGHVAARAFAAEGARVFLAARSEDKLQELRRGLPDPDRHGVFAGDLTDPATAAAMTGFLLEEMGVPNAILHCMGGGLGMHDPLLDAGQFDTLFRTNLGAGAEINRLLLPKMAENGPGYVVHVGSTASTEAIASVGYNTVKAALAAYVRSLGREYASTGVVVTGILPGAFYAPGNSWRRLEADKPDVVEKFTAERLPRGRIAEAEELLPLLFLLTGPGAAMMAGTCIAIDAGESRAYAAS